METNEKNTQVESEWGYAERKRGSVQGVIEYGLLLGLVAMVCLICMTIFWPAIVGYWMQLTAMF